MSWHKLIDFRIEHKIAADIVKGIAKKVSVRIEKVKGELYFTAENSYFKKRSGLSSYDFLSQAVMEYRLLGTTGFTGYGKKIYVNKSYDVGFQGMTFDKETGRYLNSDEELGADFIELVSLKGSYIIDGEQMVWGKNLGDKPKAPNEKTIQQKEKEKAAAAEQQEAILQLMQTAAAEAVQALSERQTAAAQKAFEEGVAAAEQQRQEHNQA